MEVRVEAAALEETEMVLTLDLSDWGHPTGGGGGGSRGNAKLPEAEER